MDTLLSSLAPSPKVFDGVFKKKPTGFDLLFLRSLSPRQGGSERTSAHDEVCVDQLLQTFLCTPRHSLGNRFTPTRAYVSTFISTCFTVGGHVYGLLPRLPLLYAFQHRHHSCYTVWRFVSFGLLLFLLFTTVILILLFFFFS